MIVSATVASVLASATIFGFLVTQQFFMCFGKSKKVKKSINIAGGKDGEASGIGNTAKTGNHGSRTTGGENRKADPNKQRHIEDSNVHVGDNVALKDGSVPVNKRKDGREVNHSTDRVGKDADNNRRRCREPVGRVLTGSKFVCEGSVQRRTDAPRSLNERQDDTGPTHTEIDNSHHLRLSRSIGLVADGKVDRVTDGASSLVKRQDGTGHFYTETDEIHHLELSRSIGFASDGKADRVTDGATSLIKRQEDTGHFCTKIDENHHLRLSRSTGLVSDGKADRVTDAATSLIKRQDDTGPLHLYTKIDKNHQVELSRSIGFVSHGKADRVTDGTTNLIERHEGTRPLHVYTKIDENHHMEHSRSNGLVCDGNAYQDHDSATGIRERQDGMGTLNMENDELYHGRTKHDPFQNIEKEPNLVESGIDERKNVADCVGVETQLWATMMDDENEGCALSDNDDFKEGGEDKGTTCEETLTVNTPDPTVTANCILGQTDDTTISKDTDAMSESISSDKEDMAMNEPRDKEDQTTDVLIHGNSQEEVDVYVVNGITASREPRMKDVAIQVLEENWIWASSSKTSTSSGPSSDGYCGGDEDYQEKRRINVAEVNTTIQVHLGNGYSGNFSNEESNNCRHADHVSGDIVYDSGDEDDRVNQRSPSVTSRIIRVLWGSCCGLMTRLNRQYLHDII